MTRLQLALDWIERIEAAPSLPLAAQTLLGLAEGQLGAGMISVVSYAGRGATAQVHERILPPGWLGSDVQLAYDKRSPLEDYCYRTRRPYSWREAMPRKDSTFGPFWEFAEGNGMSDGMIVPRFGPGGTLAGVSVAFQALDMSPVERRALTMAGHCLADRVALPEVAIQPLSPRERECLAWVAEGKTDWEIGKILSISQSTVRFHVDSARRKLGALNRVQAAVQFAMQYWL